MMLLLVSSGGEPLPVGGGEGVVSSFATFDVADLDGPDAEFACGGFQTDASGLSEWAQVVDSRDLDGVGQQGEDFAGDRAFEAADDLFRRVSFSAFLRDVLAGTPA